MVTRLTKTLSVRDFDPDRVFLVCEITKTKIAETISEKPKDVRGWAREKLKQRIKSSRKAAERHRIELEQCMGDMKRYEAHLREMGPQK